MNVIGIILLTLFLFLVLYLIVSMWIDIYSTEERITVGSKWEIWEGDPFKGHNVVEIVAEKDGYIKFTKHVYDSNNSLIYSDSTSMSKRHFTRELLKTRFNKIQ